MGRLINCTHSDCLHAHLAATLTVLWAVQEREAKRAKLKSENASAYIQEDASTSGKHVTTVSPAVIAHAA